ncbi:MAG TPA: S41 family peptidase [Bryobacteraceae bacterium]|nr:S41 family peptidase [Bryobacteraceae bacterium]
MHRAHVIAGIWCAAAVLGFTQQRTPINLDFKASQPGQPPLGWLVPLAVKGFPAVVTDQCSKPGNRCAALKSEKVAAPAPFGNLMQYIDAANYRGRRVRFRASVRVESSAGARGALWLRVDRPNQQMGFFDNMMDRPIVSASWAMYEINGDVSEDAVGIAFGVMLAGGAAGTVYIDNVTLETTGSAEKPFLTERSRPLSNRGLENVTAFARLYGYVRHFYPGDEAAHADWDALAIAGIGSVENAAGPVELARNLEAFFRPVAPLVRVFPVSAVPPKINPGSGPKIVSWKHHGFGNGKSGNIYRSERIFTGAPAGGLPLPFQADLGAGVKALVPMTIFADENGTLPHSNQAAQKAPASRYTAEDRATRVAGVVIAWNVFEHFYPYFDVVNTDWPKALEEGLRSSAAGSEKDYYITLARLTAALKDGHGGVIPGPQGAAAPFAWDWIENRLVITYVPDPQGQPIAAGDAVVSIGGKPLEKALAEAEALRSGATPQWIRHRALADLALGAPEQPLMLEIESFRDPSTRRRVVLKRNPSDKPVSDPRPEKIAELKPGIYYVDLTRITDAEWNAALPRLALATGIVFDLRGYPLLGPGWLTHLSDSPLRSAQWHIPVITEPDHKNMQFERAGEWNLPPTQPYLKARRAVLTNASAISYAESVMGIVEYYKLAEIVGSTTAGTNGNVNPIHLPGGYTLMWTGMKVLKHDGSRHHGIGIHPTIPAERTRAGVAAGRDEVLERGIRAVE